MRDAEALMREAMALARRGCGAVEPNPRVGALALRDGTVVGEGYHRRWGGLHAEAEALEAARAGGVTDVDTVVVTLEPCSARPGQGGKKRPPCTDTLLEAGVRRIIVGATDPDPRHAGAGLRLLEERGVEVQQGVLAADCEALNPFFTRWLGYNRPWTIAKWAMSLDGKIATASGDARWISSEESRRRVHALRAVVDAVVVGYRTAVRDDPRLTARGAEHEAGPQPMRVVIDPRAAMPTDLAVVQTAHDLPTCVIVREDVDARALEDHGVRILRAAAVGERGVDLGAAWAALRGELGLRRLLVEGGGATLSALQRAGCIDQVIAYVCPRLIGGAQAPTPLDGDGALTVADAARFEERWVCASGDDVEIGGILARLADPASGSD